MSKDMEKATPAWMSDGKEKFSPVRATSDRVPVAINLGEPFERYLQMYYRRLTAAAELKGGRFSLAYETFRRYIFTLLASRVNHVNRQEGAPAPVVHYNAEAAVPSLVEKALSSIGRVTLKESGITLVPTFVVDKELLLTRQEFSDVTLSLRMFEDLGFQFADVAYPRNVEGTPDLMSMQFLQNGLADVQPAPYNRPTPSGVYSHAEKSPVYAPIAFILGLRQLQSLLGARVFYADEATFEEHLIVLAAA